MYIGGADSEPRLWLLKFGLQNIFLGKFELKSHGISRMLTFIPTLNFWNSNPKIHFWENLGQKSQSCAFCLKIGTHGISRMLILIRTLVFWIFNSKFLFGQIWTKNVKVWVWQKIGTDGISRMLILIPTLVFWIFYSKFLFGQTWAKKSQTCLFFALKLTRVVSSGSWLLFRH